MNMSYSFFIGCALMIMLLTVFAQSLLAKDIENDPAGYWLSKKKDVVVRIEHCEDKLCGYIHWIREDEQQFDIYNPDPDLKGRSMCDIKVLWGLERSGSKWKGGRIYKASDGEFFGAQINMASESLIEVRGYIGMPAIGKTTPFTRVEKTDYEKCTIQAPQESLPQANENAASKAQSNSLNE